MTLSRYKKGPSTAQAAALSKQLQGLSARIQELENAPAGLYIPQPLGNNTRFLDLAADAGGDGSAEAPYKTNAEFMAEVLASAPGSVWNAFILNGCADLYDVNNGVPNFFRVNYIGINGLQNERVPAPGIRLSNDSDFLEVTYQNCQLTQLPHCDTANSTFTEIKIVDCRIESINPTQNVTNVTTNFIVNNLVAFRALDTIWAVYGAGSCIGEINGVSGTRWNFTLGGGLGNEFSAILAADVHLGAQFKVYAKTVGGFIELVGVNCDTLEVNASGFNVPNLKLRGVTAATSIDVYATATDTGSALL